MNEVVMEDSMGRAERRALARKIRRKFLIRRWVGELYVGKRMKMKYLRRLLSRVNIGGEQGGAMLLEVGSEDGAFTDFIARRYPLATVEGMELRAEWAEGCAEWARLAGRSPRVTFRQGDVLSLAEAEKYDAIFCLDVLGYISDDRRAMGNMARALRPGGVLIVHQPNRIYREFNGTEHDVTEEEAGRVTGGHVRHGYTPEEMRALAEEAGLAVEKIVLLHGKWSDVAHRVHRWLERPAVLRFLALPLVDMLWWLDARRPAGHGNTVLAFGRKAGS